MKKIFLSIIILFFFSNSSAQNGWQQVTIPTDAAYTFNTIFFVSKDVGFLYYKQIFVQSSRLGKIFMTTNGGSTYFQAPMMMMRYAHFINNTTGWLLGWTETFEVPGKYYITYKTTNGGVNWTQAELYANTSSYTNCIKFANANTGWKTKNGGTGLFKTTNGGTIWDSVASNLGSMNVGCITVDTIPASYNLVAFAFTGGVSYSATSGASWLPSNLSSPLNARPHFNFINGVGFIPGAAYVYKSTNYGAVWTNSELIPNLRDASAISSQHVWACDLSGNVKFSSNAGASFVNQFSTGVNYDSTSIFMFPADSVHHTTGYFNNGGKLYKTTTGGQTISAVINNETAVPKNFDVTVYPNPFNPISKIKVESSLFINTLSINLYDLTGKLVKSLSYSNIPAGISEFTIETFGLPTGSYLLKTTTENNSETKKIVLIK